MQDMVGGDNNRTPVIFQVSDIYRIVGEITKIKAGPSTDSAYVFQKIIRYLFFVVLYKAQVA